MSRGWYPSQWQDLARRLPASESTDNQLILPPIIDLHCTPPAEKWRRQCVRFGIHAAVVKVPGLADLPACTQRLPLLIVAAPLSDKGKGKKVSDLGAYAEKHIGIVWASDQDLAKPERMLLSLRLAHHYRMLTLVQPNLRSFAPTAQVHQCAHATRLGLAGHPPIAEHLAIHTICELVQTSGAAVHISSVSSGYSLSLIAAAKKRGLPISCDVAISNLCAHAAQIGLFDTSLKLWPPVRDKEDQLALLQGVVDGTVDCISSGHCPIDRHHKNTPFAEASFGARQWPDIYRRLVTCNGFPRLSWEKIASAIHHLPAQLISQYAPRQSLINTPALVAVDTDSWKLRRVQQHASPLTTS